MLKHLYKSMATVLLMVFAACATDTFTNDGTEQADIRIELTGQVARDVVTKALAAGPLTGYTNLKLSAKLSGDNTDYFKNVALTVGETVDNDTKNKLTADAYYPLGQTPVKLFAHTGNVDASGKITLTSGQDKANNDILISNGEDGTGTGGYSTDPVELLTFRHVMTQVEVKIDATVDPEMQETKPSSISIGFGNTVSASGAYNMTTNPGDDANNKATGTGQYTLKKGINYLVPTGSTLSGTANLIKSLVIDDYTATAADLAALTIPKAETSGGVESDLVLKPGLSYTLTFEIKRLKITGIRLTLNDWSTIQGTGTWGYESYRVGLNIGGGYHADGEKLISKMVLKHTTDGGNTYQYIGRGTVDSGNAYVDFVTLPEDLATATSLKADLYTEEGLLIKEVEITYHADTETFGMTLDENGLVQDVTGSYYEIGTPLQLAMMMKNPQARTYRLTDDIDMNNAPVTFAPIDFPTGAVLDGNGHEILHLKLTGSGLVPVNNGTLRNIRVASGTITSDGTNYIGGICGTNNRKVEGCVNEADIVIGDTQTAGGICGLNGENGTILACLNTGNISGGTTVGGICGENGNTAAGAVKACLHTGLLDKDAVNLGGICGTYASTTENKVINTCYWLTGTARKDQTISNETAIGNKDTDTVKFFTEQSADLTAESIRSSAIVAQLTSSAGPSWKFEWDATKSSWPIPVPEP